jgi:hypothetical protein
MITSLRSAIGLVVKFIVAIDEPRVRFSDGALFFTSAVPALGKCHSELS